ncbi:hypothetical protein [Streptomyces sp. GS7]|uniref:hypothetical protein n=1 Tax=Streptomyces sp. GS7 TaxID=2692234 RepID=UPI001316CA7D|nr:hypothetical protein [Streptomyces sp. GS7]QHC26512.1 hypothetical protein GR130_39275 [Streptomyces sp. GS7]
MFRAARTALTACGIAAALAFAPSAAATPSAPSETAPSAALWVGRGAPGQEVEASWLDEWRDSDEETVKVTSAAFEAPVTLTFSGRQYTGVARLRADAGPGQARARVISHGGKAVTKAHFWINDSSVGDASASVPWAVAGAGVGVGAIAAVMLTVRRRRRI